MADRVVVSSRRKKFGPATSSCGQCPWRTENQGTRHRHGWYTKKNLRRLWAGLRRGERMTCHPTDSDNPGGRDLPDSVTTKECAGAQILAQRELQRLADLIEANVPDPWATYWAENPKGLTKVGASLTAMNYQWGGVMPGTLAVGRVDLNDESISFVDLTPWEPR